ncbi:MAG: hypothetical protein K9G41_12310 [Flavobacteriales bacterium]|nr:hypothetical protein [Flavobacteriales bacterium]
MSTLFIDMEYLPAEIDVNRSWFSLKAIADTDGQRITKTFLIQATDTNVLRAALKTCGIAQDDYNVNAMAITDVLDWLSIIDCNVVASDNIHADVELIRHHANRLGHENIPLLTATPKELDSAEFEEMYQNQILNQGAVKRKNPILRITEAKPKIRLPKK